jgi:hypothetical protein
MSLQFTGVSRWFASNEAIIHDSSYYVSFDFSIFFPAPWAKKAGKGERNGKGFHMETGIDHTTGTREQAASMNPLYVFLLITSFIVLASGFCFAFPVAIGLPLSILLPLVTHYGVLSGRFPAYTHRIFSPVKLFSVAVFAIFYALAILGTLAADTFQWIALALLAINMVEAVLTEFRQKNHANAVAGAFLVACIPFFRVVLIDDYFALQADFFLYWAIAYTIWNWYFVLKAYPAPGASLFYLGVLLAPFMLLVLFELDAGAWLILRTYTLLLAVVIHTTIARDTFFPRMLSASYDAAVARLDLPWSKAVMAAITILLALPAFLAGI